MRIVATAAVPPVAHRAFAPLGTIEVNEGPDAVVGAEVLLLRGQRVDRSDIERAADLKVIARTGVGVDNVDVTAATEARVPIVFAPSVGTRPVAEGALTLILAAVKRLGELGSVLRENRWSERYELENLDLHGLTLGIVGYGSIGREVGRLARAVGMEPLACDPHLDAGEVDGVPLLSLEEVVTRCDVLSLHCPLTAETRGFVDEGLLARMKPGAIFVNTARGELVASDEVLIEALESGQLRGVALDVFEREPPAATSPLLADPRVVCSPHTIGLTRTWNDLVFESLAADVARLLRGETPVNLIDPAALGRDLVQ